jgi:hypothetical protein
METDHSVSKAELVTLNPEDFLGSRVFTEGNAETATE